MKAKFWQFPVLMLLIMTIGFFSLNSCGGGNDGNKQVAEVRGSIRTPLADGVALFGYNSDDNQFFVQHVTSWLGAEINHGSWSSGNKWKPMTSFTVGGKQYIMGHKKNPNTYFIQEVYPSGDLGKETDTGTWHNYYEVLIGLVAGNRTFIYGESKDASDYWFVQEILPGGKLGAETDSGEWGVTYDAVVALPLPNKACFFAHTADDDQFYKTMCLTADGKLYQQDQGHWKYHWETVASYRAGGKTYLFTHRSRYDSADVTYRGPWSIVRISDNGDVWGDTDSGEWGHYYKTMTTFYDQGKDTYYLAGMNTDKHFFIQHVTFDGTMGEETYSADWGNYYDYFFPIDLDTKYLYTDAWMGKQLSLIGDRKLTEIAMPGSHDAGMNEADRGDCNPAGSATKANTVTQQGDIAFQLDRGSRYFDLRPVLDNGSDGTDNWRTGHNKKWGASLFGCKGEDKNSIVTAVNEFMNNSSHKNELVTLKISHCTMRDAGLEHDCTSTQLNNLAKNLAGQLNGHLFKCNDCKPAEMTLNNILKAGNVLIAVSGEKIDSKPPDINVESNKAGGIFKYGAGSGDDFYLYDNYANSIDYDTMRNDQIAKLNNPTNHYNNGKSIPFLLSWTLTLQSSTGNILENAWKAQWRLYQEMVDLNNAGIKRSLFPNILYVDDFNGTATRAAMYLNQADGDVLWSSKTAGNPGAHNIMQDDGNYVIYKPEKALWATRTDGNPGAYNVMLPGGNYVIYSKDGKLLWQSGTDGNPGAYKKMQSSDGNLVIYSKDGKVLWQSGTTGNPGAYDVMQADGNYVIYTGTALWATRTDGNPGAYKKMQSSDGNLVIYSKDGKALWSSGTSGNPGAYDVMQENGNYVILNKR